MAPALSFGVGKTANVIRQAFGSNNIVRKHSKVKNSSWQLSTSNANAGSASNPDRRIEIGAKIDGREANTTQKSLAIVLYRKESHRTSSSKEKSAVSLDVLNVMTWLDLWWLNYCCTKWVLLDKCVSPSPVNDARWDPGSPVNQQSCLSLQCTTVELISTVQTRRHVDVFLTE